LYVSNSEPSLSMLSLNQPMIDVLNLSSSSLGYVFAEGCSFYGWIGEKKAMSTCLLRRREVLFCLMIEDFLSLPSPAKYLASSFF